MRGSLVLVALASLVTLAGITGCGTHGGDDVAADGEHRGQQVQFLVDSDGTFESSPGAAAAQTSVHVVLTNATTGQRLEDDKPYASELALDLKEIDPGAWEVRVELREDGNAKVDAGVKFDVKLEQLVRITIQLRAFAAGLGQLSLQVKVLDDATRWRAKGVAAGNFGTCALTATDTVFCWGQGQAFSDIPTQITGFSRKPVRVFAGRYEMCAAMEGGGMECWHPELDPTTNHDRSIPREVDGLPAGEIGDALITMDLDCALVGADVYCWNGEIPSHFGSANARKIGGAPGNVKRLFLGESYYGSGFDVELTDGSVERLTFRGDASYSIAQSDVVLPSGALDALSDLASACDARVDAAGTRIHCTKGLASDFVVDPAIAPDGVQLLGFHTLHCVAGLGGTAAKCWGEAGGDADLNGEGYSYGDAPKDIQGIAGPITSLSVGARHACAINTGGDMYCWGRNDYGQLGVGTPVTGRQLTAVLVNRL